jgi:hypothetical protein
VRSSGEHRTRTGVGNYDIPFSANVFDARYFCITAASRPFSSTSFVACSFQSFSLYVIGLGSRCKTAAQDEVTTILLTSVLGQCVGYYVRDTGVEGQRAAPPMLEDALDHGGRAFYGRDNKVLNGMCVSLR